MQPITACGYIPILLLILALLTGTHAIPLGDSVYTHNDNCRYEEFSICSSAQKDLDKEVNTSSSEDQASASSDIIHTIEDLSPCIKIILAIAGLVIAIILFCFVQSIYSLCSGPQDNTIPTMHIHCFVCTHITTFNHGGDLNQGVPRQE
ncbi:8337_t:CDS:2 [Paraglomus brasilianum]|uniref:8337_t:CDS:1 n=1 Tax=Paraglomus brasilianum TaxID=144538 RepID=A0A9N9CSH5_9GLOM|nr:8337_t:CDS:2 [Paraglomus brasilianum]